MLNDPVGEYPKTRDFWAAGYHLHWCSQWVTLRQCQIALMCGNRVLLQAQSQWPSPLFPLSFPLSPTNRRTVFLRSPRLWVQGWVTVVNQPDRSLLFSMLTLVVLDPCSLHHSSFSTPSFQTGNQGVRIHLYNILKSGVHRQANMDKGSWRGGETCGVLGEICGYFQEPQMMVELILRIPLTSMVMVSFYLSKD